MTHTLKSAHPHSLGRLFYGPRELRAGWRLLVFVGIVAILMAIKGLVDRRFSSFMDRQTWFFVGEAMVFLIFLLATWIMGKVEGRTVADYGLPGSQAFRGRFWQGVALGFTLVTVLLCGLRGFGVFQFGEMGIHGADIWKWGAVWALAFLAVGFKEEFMFRGYAQFTLSTGIGFWPAAVLWSSLFGLGHLGNLGETWAGALAGIVYGLLACLLLRRTSSLWMPIGLHAGWDWAETYFYGVADSGTASTRHFFNPHFSGPAWLTGGSVGPEGSVLCLVLLIGLFLVFAGWFGQSQYPDPSEANRPWGNRAFVSNR